MSSAPFVRQDRIRIQVRPLEEVREAQHERILRRGRLLVALILLALAAAVGRVVQLKVSPEAPLQSYLSPPTSTHLELGRRGDVVDLRGRVLATSVVRYRLFIDPQAAEDLDALARELAPRIGAHPQEILQQVLRRPGSRYVVLDQELEDWQVDAVRHGRSALRGVGLEPRLVRRYPHNDVGASIIGFVGIDHNGLAGAELRVDEVASPQHGRLTYQRDALGRVLWIEDEDFVPKRDGEDVRLSLDLVVQEYVEERLEKAAREFNARGARAVVMDAVTGDLLAVADVLRERKGFLEVIEGDRRDIHPAQGRQRCTSDPYEPGSTFKPFVWAAALDAGKIRPSEIIPLPHGLYRTSRGRPIRDVKSYGPVSAETVLVKSLNSGMAVIGERFTPRELRDTVLRFGFGERTGCGLPGETAGRVTPARLWNHHSQTSVPMGQEISVTLVQMARAFSAFCRDGTLASPRLILPPPGAEPRTIAWRAVSEQAALTTRRAMHKVMLEGTGRRAQSERYEIFGKSGTPQLPIPKRLEKRVGRRGYFEDRYTSNFVAGAPLEDPRVVVVVTIDDPDRRREHFGGITAGPVARDIIDFTLSYLGVPPDKDTEEPTAVAQR